VSSYKKLLLKTKIIKILNCAIYTLVLHDHLQIFSSINFFPLLYALYMFFHISIKFTHLMQNILELFKSKIYKSAPLNLG